MLAEFAGRHVLLLQGPMGPFFSRLRQDLREAGARVSKVNFNAGDELFHRGPGTIPFQGTREEFGGWLAEYIERHDVDIVMLFGDMRPIHRAAIPVVRGLGKRLFVFEEGYLRPDHVTCEEHGVNGNSKMPRDPTVFRDAGMTPFADVVPVGATFGVAALYSTLYSIAVTLGRFRYPRYVHHRNIHALYHTWHWVLGGFRKLWFKVLERDRIEQFSGPLSGRFFFVPLQVHCDAQLDHSPYADVCDFMEEVAESFSSHAPEDAHLLFKHHPADRPFREYGSFVAQLARKHGLQGRLHYVHDLHLPTLLRHTVGTVTINSTVGLSSIHHAAPTKVLGNAVYDIEGLTHQGDLASFWHDPGEVDLDLYIAYRGWLEHHNQANGSIWKPLHTDDAGTGLRWWDRPPRTQEPKR